MVAVFRGYSQTIIVGLDENGDIIDKDQTIFGDKSGRNIRHFQRYDVDLKNGQSIHIASTPSVRFMGGECK